ncbi:hypothetical protein [Wielerella bovis]|uniref:hypothetical protein n=1 Tax=Wielerella bovis TaxID=2917790 RepID=UPI002019DD04|nr:hypothetical protein [Wielerella bovis]ULJ60222.1 hypothetical protein MIS44_11345 [Wielerella bovis]
MKIKPKSPIKKTLSNRAIVSSILIAIIPAFCTMAVMYFPAVLMIELGNCRDECEFPNITAAASAITLLGGLSLIFLIAQIVVSIIHYRHLPSDTQIQKSKDLSDDEQNRYLNWKHYLFWWYCFAPVVTIASAFLFAL